MSTRKFARTGPPRGPRGEATHEHAREPRDPPPEARGVEAAGARALEPLHRVGEQLRRLARVELGGAQVDLARRVRARDAGAQRAQEAPARLLHEVARLPA